MEKIKKRCPWVPKDNLLYEKYHDIEWGVPTHNDRKLFEFLVLESAQAGLSWETILKKRKGYKKLFANFNPQKVVVFTKRDVTRLLNLTTSEIIRNRSKIEATINNAKKFLEVQKEFGTFSKYQWGFVGGKQIVNKVRRIQDYKVSTSQSDAMAKDMKKRGFKFLGSTTLYAHMQAVGMVNDHAVDCFRYREVMK
ncbi:MAG: DNA-3-methyladenine glycosylase [Candidatus Spechtbacteria bacterium RIFCSPLOWO2_12_FULL_38_22]|uniref:DNA-3-methyladenine glycosylase n=1 Tax=Candidatus Spechtbacteria bacterium RIFCSPLOWO2_12_FULL_38_22 TaxID=1802165 RepID=A0A1G2HFV8_9BACT|nr:MAG: DNA-3-methyladenine glycosylase [Candidatus Spechtbacteria bacterium RIFCSPLOWO2_01_FULL_38_20]OGZ59554.1 MAG: DNA-3-methyladenine glycosylase [Candidatus Spechtbacteria bacterium RIFCSPHIGHO2_12_FULL_38_30]OGZ61372.1 MAG: DNA-3-methyladenine glycosylase [Candidatus Spechtbacteria bacterium RIFCSPLOWO2_12_FULL_38_22]